MVILGEVAVFPFAMFYIFCVEDGFLIGCLLKFSCN